MNFYEEKIARHDLRRAADLLEEKGWVKGYLRTANGFCMAGAITEVTNKCFTTSGSRKRRWRAIKLVAAKYEPVE